MHTSTRIPNWLEQRAHSCPDQPAIIADSEVLTYAELARRAAIVSKRFAGLGVRRGDRIGVLVRNRVEFVELMYGLMRLGAVLVPLNCRLTAAELAVQLQDSGARLLVYDATTRETVTGLDAIEPSHRIAQVCVDDDALNCDATRNEESWTDHGADPRHDLDAVHSIIFTSGSTGRPKGVLLTYGNYLWSALNSAFNLGIQPDERWLACLPFCHVGGLSILLRSVIYGTTAVIHDGFDPLRVNHSIDAGRVTIISVAANMLQRLLDARDREAFPEWLHCVLLGGGRTPRALLEACAARRVPVVQTYGLTEAASQVTTLAPRDALRKLGAAGKPLLATEVTVAGPNGTVSADEVGEILVRGPTVSPGYVANQAHCVSSDGWLHTGDRGRLDSEGFLYVLGRADEMIISGGENIYPAEVETVLQQHPAVAEACVFGIPDTRWGQAVAACVRLRPHLTVSDDALRAHARRLLAGFKVPRQVHFVVEFPRTAAGKVDARRVVAQVIAGSPGT
jgi:O-succinylbenzoic acid--CoA ligase